MANWSDPRTAAAPRSFSGARDAAYDAGLRAYMLSVYNYMVSGVLLTAIVALLFSRGAMPAQSIAGQIFLAGGPMPWIVMLAPLGIVMWLSFGINRISEGTAKALFWAYAALMGASLSTVLLAYTGGSVAQAFFATSAAFAGLSLWGYTTKRDLSGFGTFLIMGVVGLMVAMVINMFIKSGPLDLVISGFGVLIFSGLTAYRTQQIKSGYFAVQGSALLGKSAIMGALQLYLDFINLFLFLLRFMGNRR